MDTIFKMGTTFKHLCSYKQGTIFCFYLSNNITERPFQLVDNLTCPVCKMAAIVCLCVLVSVCLSVCNHDNSKNNGSIHLKLVRSRSRSQRDFEIFLHSPTIQTVKSYISALAHVRKL